MFGLRREVGRLREEVEELRNEVKELKKLSYNKTQRTSDGNRPKPKTGTVLTK